MPLASKGYLESSYYHLLECTSQDGVPWSAVKSQKEGQEDQGTLKQLGNPSKLFDLSWSPWPSFWVTRPGPQCWRQRRHRLGGWGRAEGFFLASARIANKIPGLPGCLALLWAPWNSLNRIFLEYSGL